MTLNLNDLCDILKQLYGTRVININSQKQESSTVNQNGNNNVIIIGNGNIVINNFNLFVVTNLDDIKKVWPSIGQDLPVKFGSSDNLWLHTQINPLCVNIGKYYSCEVKEGKTIVFWLGAEAMEDEAYVQLYINEDQLKQLKLPKLPETICGETAKKGVFQPRINKFSPDAGQEALEAAVREGLQEFLQDIFKDT